MDTDEKEWATSIAPTAETVKSQVNGLTAPTVIRAGNV